MSNKLPAETLRAASLVLTGTAATVVGTASTDNANASSGAVKLGALTLVMLRCSYARHASSTTGRPAFIVDVSMDAASTDAASVSNWQSVYLIDSSSFSSGAVDLYAETQLPRPSVTGTTVFGTHPVNVACANWLRVRMYDFDGTNPGTVTNLSMGGTI